MKPQPVVLVYPYFLYRDPVPKLFPPLGLLSLAAQLKQKEIPVHTVDCTFLTREQALEQIAAFRPALVGVYAMVSLSRNALELVQDLRTRLPHAHFVAGGPLPTLYPDRFVPPFDLVFRGESDGIFPQFCLDFLQTGDAWEELDLTPYPGLYQGSGSLDVNNPPTHHSAALLNTLPTPDRSDIDHGLYQRHWMQHAGCKETSIIITRGCPYSCDFCSKPVWGSEFRKPSLERVFQEMEEIHRLGYDRLWIADDSFTLDLSFLRSFCEEKIARDLPLTWTCLSRVDRLDSDLILLMKKAGCVEVFLGLESGSDDTLRLMHKRTTVAEGIRAVHLFHHAGIKVSGFFMVGYPGETWAAIEATLDFALSLPLHEISVNIPYPLPGSPLFSRVGSVESRDWESAGEITFLYRSEFDESRIRARIESTLEQFKKKRGSARTPSESVYLPVDPETNDGRVSEFTGRV